MEFSQLNGYKVKDKKAIRFYDNVESMKSDTTLKSGMYVKTKGYYSVNDGGGAEYHVTNTASQSDYQEELNNGLYATLLDIKINGYIDLRWLGADSNGINGASDYLEAALELSNKNYLIPIKVIGKYYLEKAINFTGSITLFGMHTPGTEDFLITQETTDYTITPISQFILNNNITAINLTGIGSNTHNISILNLKNISITEKNNQKTSTFIDINAFGGPGRPIVIREVGCYGINTLLSAIHVDTSTYTNIMNVDIGNINCYRCGYIFNFPTLSTNNEGLMNLNLHDSILENSKGFILKSLGCYNQIKSCLLESLSEDCYISVKRAASLDFVGNYFEQNNHDIIFDCFPTYSNNQVTDMPNILFRDNFIPQAVNTGKFKFNNSSVDVEGYFIDGNLEYKNCFLKLNSSQYNKDHLRLNFLIPSSSVLFNHVRFKDTIDKTFEDLELTSNTYAYPATYPETAYMCDGVKCWKLSASSNITLTQSLSITANDYVGILFYKGGNDNAAIQLSLLTGSSIGVSHIPTLNMVTPGYYLYITKVDSTANVNVYFNNLTANDLYISPVKLINFGQDLTQRIEDKLSLYI